MTVTASPSNPSPKRAARPAKLLLPREHGAYGQLGVPLLAALLARPITAPAVLLLAAPVALFVAHEPLLVLLGLRGARALRDDGPRARKWLLTLTSIGALLGAIGALKSSPDARLALVIPVGLAAVVGGFIAARRERTLLGETVAACALASTGVPVMVAGGASLPAALWCWLAWCVGFGAVTPAVRGVIANHKRPATMPSRLGAIVPSWVVVIAMLAASAPRASVVGALPLLLFSSALAVFSPSARHVKRVGWGLIAACALTCAALVRG